MEDITVRFLEVYNYLLSVNKIANSSDFAKKIDVSSSMISEIIKGRSNAGIKVIQNTVLKFKEINLDWLIKGDGKMIADFKINIPFKDLNEEWVIEKYGIPLLPIEAIGGNGDNSGYSIQRDMIEEKYVIPLFDNKGVDFLISVRGSSMYPKYASGDLVACKFINELLFIQWNKVHVIDSISQGAMIKRIVKSENSEFIICRSDNDSYDDFEIPMKDIRNIALVIGTIRLE